MLDSKIIPKLVLHREIRQPQNKEEMFNDPVESIGELTLNDKVAKVVYDIIHNASENLKHNWHSI